jgi:hypothetical protein
MLRPYQKPPQSGGDKRPQANGAEKDFRLACKARKSGRVLE